MRTPTRIAEALWPQTRRRVLGLLFARPDRALHLRQIARDTGTAVSAVQREVNSLAEAGLLTRSQAGRQVNYQANRSSPVFSELRAFIMKTVGMADVLVEALAPLADQIEVAFVYGSCARGEETAASDVDVLIIGLDPDVIAINVALSDTGLNLGREINPVIMTAAEFRRRLTEGDHFLNAVTASPLIFLIGDEHELTRLGS
jgi:predicted nucleotidyltransferase